MQLLIPRFLLASLQLQEILLNAPSDMRAALNDLPRSPDAAYRKVLARIEKKGKVTRTRAYHALSWVFHAIRPLGCEELLAIVNVESDGKDSENPVTEIGHIIEACEGLIVDASESRKRYRIVRFAHSTVREFLQEFHDGTDRALGSSLLRQADIALSCIRYLDSERFECGDWESDSHRLVAKHKFAEYAACFWAVHTKGQAEKIEGIQKEILILASEKSRRNGVSRVALLPPRLYRFPPRFVSLSWPSFEEDHTILHFLAAHGLATICDLALNGLLISSDR